VDLDDRAIQAHRLDPNADELLLLQLLKEPIEHTGFGPTIHASVDRMPVAEALRQSAPFAAVLRHVKDRVDDSDALVRDVAALSRQKRFDASELFCRDFHAASISINVNRP
jgi:hypothetical protein